jgi:hypothetical protein
MSEYFQGTLLEAFRANTFQEAVQLATFLVTIIAACAPRHCLLGGVNATGSDRLDQNAMNNRFRCHKREWPNSGSVQRLLTIDINQGLLQRAADHLRGQYQKCHIFSSESLLAALLYSLGAQLDTFANVNAWGANCTGPAKLYIMIWDCAAFTRGNNPRSLTFRGLTKRHLGLDLWTLGLDSFTQGTCAFSQGTDAVTQGTAGGRSAVTLANDRALLQILNAETLAPHRQFRNLNDAQRRQVVLHHLKFIGMKSRTSKVNKFMYRLSKRPHLYAHLLQ